MSENWLALKMGEIDTVQAFVDAVNAALGKIVGDSLRMESLALPTEADAAKAWLENLDLYGTISFVGKCAGTIEVPLPYEGVFLSENWDGAHPHRFVWSSWLAERPGVWKIKSPTEKTAHSWRVGLADGSYFGLDIDKRDRDGKIVETLRYERKSRKGNKAADESPYIKAYDKQCDWIRNSLGELGFSLQTNSAAYGDVKTILQELLDNPQNRDVLMRLHEYEKSSSQTTLNYDCLDHRQAITFPVWLKHRICRRVYDMREHIDSADFGQKLAYGLVPLSGRGPLGPNAGGLTRIEPKNALDLISEITGIKRRWVNRTSAERIPVEYRQNDESFDGRICPIETPESEMVGVQLQFASGAVVNADGSISPAVKDGSLPENVSDAPLRLGWGVAMIPFANHNDGARNMMGAKNLRQAIPVCGAKPPLVKTGVESRVIALAAGSMRAGLCPDCGTRESLSIGRNLLVAYLPWYGWNVDDAVVVSRSLCEKMAVIKRLSFSRMIAPGWRLDESGETGALPMATPGTDLTRGTQIVRLKNSSGKVKTFRYSDREPATLLRIAYAPQKGFAARLEFEIERRIPLGLGDKLMGRHGNKGVVSLILPDDEMPRVGGQPVDILLNPHGVLSRMNPSQLLETHVGWLFAHGVAESEILSTKYEGIAVGYPDSSVLDHEKIRADFMRTGLDRNGKTKLSWLRKDDTGGFFTVETEQPVMVGYQYFVRLDHIPELKAQARRGGDPAEYSYSVRTAQAAHGRNVCGGQRFGEMEFWALEAHGAEKTIEELLTRQSGKRSYREYFSDWMRALLVDFNIDGDKAIFSTLTFATPNPSAAELNGLIGKLGGVCHRVVATDIIRPRKTAMFCCRACGKTFLNGRMFALPSKGGGKGLTVGNFLAAFGLETDGRLASDGENGYALKCRRGIDEVLAHVSFAECLSQQSLIRATLKIDVGDNELMTVNCRVKYTAVNEEIERFSLDGRNPSLPFSAAIVELQQEKSLRRFTDFLLLCPDDPNEELKADVGVESASPDFVSGGLYDPEIFGTRKSLATFDNQQWGYIELPVSIRAPNCKGRWIRILPVLPIRYRLSADPNEPSVIDGLYQRVLESCKSWEKATTDAARNKVSDSLEWKVAKLLDFFLTGKKKGRQTIPGLIGKRGLVRREGLGRRIDHSFRLVITPNPDLEIDEIRVPTDILWEIIGDTCGCLLEDGYDTRHNDELVGWSWQKGLKGTRVSIEQQYAVLKKYCEEHEPRIVLNRQPSLHKETLKNKCFKTLRLLRTI